ncbi:hypothetical protein P8452_41020 [Trifolium repens]|nr:hypothetical protein P8452_41020 [Trifolium repens]
MAKLSFVPMIVLLFVFLAKQSWADCIATKAGDCFKLSCEQWCAQAFTGGRGFCQQYGDPSSPKFECKCVHPC